MAGHFSIDVLQSNGQYCIFVLKSEMKEGNCRYTIRMTMISFQIEGTKGIQNQEKLHHYVK